MITSAAASGARKIGLKKAAIPVKMQAKLEESAEKKLIAEPKVAPIAIAGATSPPAHPATNVKNVEATLPKTS